MTKRILTDEQLREIACTISVATGEECKDCGEKRCVEGKFCDHRRDLVIAYWARVYGCSAQQIYRWAREGGWHSGRKPRADAGARRRAVDADAIERAALIKYSTTGKYHAPMPAEVAAEIGGHAGVSAHHINEHLRAMALDRSSTARDVPRIQRRTERPNDEHQFDTSVCACWYLEKAPSGKSPSAPFSKGGTEGGSFSKGGTGEGKSPSAPFSKGGTGEGKSPSAPFSKGGTKGENLSKRGTVAADDQNIIRFNRQAGRDKNKPEKGKPLIRYVLVDHFTHAMYVQYIDGHESFLTSARFLHDAWSRKPDPEQLPFCGTPKVLYLDQGATFKSGHIKQLCINLGVELRPKQPTGVRSKSGKRGSPAALGSVEGAHWIIEKNFESRLRLQKPRTLEELNELAYKWCVDWNGTKVHSRYGMTRSALWSTIRSDELRIPPVALDAFMSLAERPQKCHIYGDLTIRFKGERYALEGVPVDLRETDAEVMYSPYDFPKVRVKGHDGAYYLARPLAKLDPLEGGYYEDAVLDGEFRSFADTTTERSQKRAERADPGEVDAFAGMGERIKNMRYISRGGEEIQPPARVTRMSLLKAKEQIVRTLGRRLTIEESDELLGTYGEWMTAEEIENAIGELQRQQPRINTDLHG